MKNKTKFSHMILNGVMYIFWDVMLKITVFQSLNFFFASVNISIPVHIKMKKC